MDTRTSFREALRDVQRYRSDSLGRRPAFGLAIERLAKPDLPDAASLPPFPAVASGPGNIAEVSRRMAEGSTSAVEQTRQALAMIQQREAELNAFAYIASEESLLQIAQALDNERDGGGPRGPLHGVPVSVKDVIHVNGMPTSSSSRVMDGFMADTDAEAVRLLREAGSIIMGKTQTHEFALGVTTPQSRNPWDPTRDPGGSSGGSAISIATGMSLLSLGTDTRASIRVPASLCGIVGYKPTFGLVSTDGIVTLSWSMDHAGLQGRTVEDVAIMMNVVQGVDARESSSAVRRPKDYTSYLRRDVSGLRVGVPTSALNDADDDVVGVFHASVEMLRTIGVDIVDVSFPSDEDFRMATNVGLIVSRCEAAAYHQSFENAAGLYTLQVFEQLDEAAKVSAVDYLNAQRFRSEFQERMSAHLEGFDALLMPTTLVTAPPSEQSGEYLIILSRNCIPWSFTGLPALSVPGGVTDQGLPVGVQLVGAAFNDGTILALASALEAAIWNSGRYWPAGTQS